MTCAQSARRLRGGKSGKVGKGLGTLPSNTAHKHPISEGSGRTNMVAEARKSRVIVVVVATTTGSATRSHLASILPNRRQGYPTSDERVLDLRNAIPPANDADKGRVPESRRRTCRTPHTDTNTATSGTARRANGGGGLAQGGVGSQESNLRSQVDFARSVAAPPPLLNVVCP